MIDKMKKKVYECPETATVQILAANQLLTASPVQPDDPDQPAGSREDNADWED